MRVIRTEIGVERELRRRGWSEVAHALQRRRRKAWFVQEANEFLVCDGHRLYWYKVEAKDNPWTLYPFKRYLAGLVNLTPRHRSGLRDGVIRRQSSGGRAVVTKTQMRRALRGRGRGGRQ